MRLIINAVIFILSVAAAYTEVKVYPVPWVPQAGIEGKIQTGGKDGITFSGLPQSGEITICSISGAIVRHIEFSDNSTGIIKLFGESDSSNEYAASGIYIWRVTAPGLTSKGKLIIIR